MLVLVVRGGSQEPEYTTLSGKTSRGQNVRLTLADGTLQSFDVYPSGFCRRERDWRPWLWSRNVAAITFEQNASRFHVRERSRVGVGGQRVDWVAVMRGELDDNGRAAHGTLHARWSFDGGSCEGRVRFSARRTP